MSNIYGYARVSTREQNLARQLLALQQQHIPEKNIYVDHVSGKDFHRPSWHKMEKKLKKNDTLYVVSIDRLGRNYNEILKVWRLLSKEREVEIVVLDMPLLDTRRDKDLLGTLISDMVLQLLSFVAESERNNIRQRQAEGIYAAKKRGVRFGRPPLKLPDNFPEIYEKWKQKELSTAQAAVQCRMPKTTFYEKAKKYGKAAGGKEDDTN